MSEARGIKGLFKRIVRKALRPALWPISERIETIEQRMNNQAQRLQAINQRTDGWAKTMAALPARLDHMDAALERLVASGSPRDKHHHELAYWRWLIKTEEGRASLYAPFETAFSRWQRDRLRELGKAVGLDSGGGSNGSSEHIDAALDEWCTSISVVELGAGPYPAIAAAPAWRRAVAVDPLAKSYVEEGLLTAAASRVTYIEANGEHIPLPPGFADLVVMDNALDHVTDPGAVLDEVNRLLRPGGLLWVLVDLSTHKDHMHPNPFDELSLRALLRAKSFEVVTDRVSGHKSHPKAYGEYRGLLRRPDPRANLDVVVTTASRKSPVGDARSH